MAKLPPDFVKAPVFDHPIRSTTRLETTSKTREIVLRVDEALYAQIEAAAVSAKTTPVALAKSIIEAWATLRNAPAPAPSIAASAPQAAQPASGAPEPKSLLAPTALAARLIGLVSGQLRKIRLVEASLTWALERVRAEPAPR